MISKERKSDLVWSAGFFMVLLPVVAFLSDAARHFAARLLLPQIIAGGVVFFCGFFVLARAHEYAKSLEPCGKVHEHLKKEG